MFFWIGVVQARGAVASENPVVSDPESVGFSSERLKRLDAVMRQAVDDKEYPGVVTLLARHGKIVHFSAIGRQDLEAGVPVSPDTIFRIASLSKPVTAVGMMILYEEGKWTLQDPIAKFVPEFADLQVYAGQTDLMGKVQVESPAHPPTVFELMTHTAGFGYGYEQTPAERLYRDNDNRAILDSGSLQVMISRLSSAPLLYQPGTRWKYSLSSDIQGYIIEKLSGMTLPQFLKKRVFEPLGMSDTDFYVPGEKRKRFAVLYKMKEDGDSLERVPPEMYPYGSYDRVPALPLGGGGLVSTAVDYFRLCQMLLNGGQLGGVRILAPGTVKLILSNHLPEKLMGDYKGPGFVTLPRPGLGYGFGGSVVTDPGLAAVPMGKGSYMWDGAFGTWFWIDPTNDIVFVGMVQRTCWLSKPCVDAQKSRVGMPPNLEELSRGMIYQALLSPEK